jgi:hypothetical protein
MSNFLISGNAAFFFCVALIFYSMYLFVKGE